MVIELTAASDFNRFINVSFHYFKQNACKAGVISPGGAMLTRPTKHKTRLVYS